MIQPKGDGTTHASTRRIEEPALAPMPTPADDLAQLLGAVLAYRPQPRAWPRPRPPHLPHPRRRLPRIRGGAAVLEGLGPCLPLKGIIQPIGVLWQLR